MKNNRDGENRGPGSPNNQNPFGPPPVPNSTRVQFRFDPRLAFRNAKFYFWTLIPLGIAFGFCIGNIYYATDPIKVRAYSVLSYHQEQPNALPDDEVRELGRAIASNNTAAAQELLKKLEPMVQKKADQE